MSAPTTAPVSAGIRLSGRRITIVTAAAVYLVAYRFGFRGGDRAMVRRPHIGGAAPGMPPGIPGAGGGADVS